MRKLVINMELGFEKTAEEMILSIAKTGWDGVFTDWYENGENAKLAKQVCEVGLMYQSVHAPFDKCNYLWEDEEKGEEECRRLMRCLHDCADIEVPLVIMHAIIGMKRNTPTAYRNVFTNIQQSTNTQDFVLLWHLRNSLLIRPCGFLTP